MGEKLDGLVDSVMDILKESRLHVTEEVPYEGREVDENATFKEQLNVARKCAALFALLDKE